MIVKNSFQGLKNKFRNIVVGLGNFDGVHIGHQKLITKVVDTARSINGTATIFTFNPHPLAVLDPKNDPPKLLSQQNKEKIMGKLGVDVILSIPFNYQFAKIEPEDFIKKVLHQQMGVCDVVVGYNFSFGRKGRGTADTLRQYAEKYRYTLHVIPPVTIGEQVVSSTVIRKMLLAGDVETAAKLLGYLPFVQGVVVTGDRRGNAIGFPTANINLNSKTLAPANGVYSVHVEINGETYLGVANIGRKPTFNKTGGTRNLEVHLLDFSGNIYGQLITVKFLRRLRSEQRFNSVNELICQIEQDIQMALSHRQTGG
ncbi:riboflavin kinase/FMN adenylyltransferase [Desulfohalotomaculum tongense]|uniref:bifunctional riboflavin kinase/FAD synthetase n=1 Tax=Desulforadius tongensis TaxID=1216062 RepID=UPI001959142F|nr:bifunctional riboflavin kinase/FAD synthetase [Desulforadius tongensis]MBM7854443.1 riboflavin kinase/FMN adenylyltransferase [Desulforadius tongensis]